MPQRLLAAMLLYLATPPAHADEGEWRLGVEPFVALVHEAAAVEAALVGGGARLNLDFGLTALSWLYIAADGMVFESGKTLGGFAMGWSGSIDIAVVVPTLSLGFGLSLQDDRPKPRGELGLSVDHFVTPSLSVGAALRYAPSIAHAHVGTFGFRVNHTGF